MEIHYVSGIVKKFFTQGDDQLVLMQRKTKDTQFVCRFKKGEHKALTEGEDKKFAGMTESPDPYKDFDTYDFVGEQAKTSDQTYTPTDPQSDVKTEIPETVSMGEITAGMTAVTCAAVHEAAAVGLLTPGMDEFEREKVIIDSCFLIMKASKRVQKLLTKEV